MSENQRELKDDGDSPVQGKEVHSESAGDGSAAADSADPGPGDEDHDPHYEPIVSLPVVQLPDTEADETVMVQLRAKLFRLDSSQETPEWKERGTGEVKVLRHRQKQRARLLMRRDKTLKVCANHLIPPHITLLPNCGSDRAWVWSVACDFADEEPRPEMLAIRFANADNARKFRDAFVEAQKIMSDGENEDASEERGGEEAEEEGASEPAPSGLEQKLAGLSV